jgi:Peptidase family M23
MAIALSRNSCAKRRIGSDLNGSKHICQNANKGIYFRNLHCFWALQFPDCGLLPRCNAFLEREFGLPRCKFVESIGSANGSNAGLPSSTHCTIGVFVGTILNRRVLGLVAAIAAANGDAAAVSASAASGDLTERLPGAGNESSGKQLNGWSRAPNPAPKLIEKLSVHQASRVSAPLFISSGYGWRTDPFGRGGRRHEGIDLPGRLGSRVYATGAGLVSFAGRAGGYGNLVQISHPGGLVTRYGHLSQILVAEGSTVSKGEVVGLMGSTGRSTGSHLHYEIRVRGVPVNPLDFVDSSTSFEPHYGVTWPEPVKVKPRWTGWTDGGSELHLPEASIR